MKQETTHTIVHTEVVDNKIRTFQLTSETQAKIYAHTAEQEGILFIQYEI